MNMGESWSQLLLGEKKALCYWGLRVAEREGRERGRDGLLPFSSFFFFSVEMNDILFGLAQSMASACKEETAWAKH